MIEIADVTTRAQFDTVREMCREYRAVLLAMKPAYAGVIEKMYPTAVWAELLENLETLHMRPNGTLKLATQSGAPVGCGMAHRLDPGVAEIKRVYVRDAARGLGAGRAIMEALVVQLKADGVHRILMDTMAPLEAAQSLYLSMGFRLRGPYQDIPEGAEDKMVFFEMNL